MPKGYSAEIGWQESKDPLNSGKFLIDWNVERERTDDGFVSPT